MCAGGVYRLGVKLAIQGNAVSRRMPKSTAVIGILRNGVFDQDHIQWGLLKESGVVEKGLMGQGQ